MNPKLMCLCFIMVVTVCKAQPIIVEAMVLSPSLQADFTDNGEIGKSDADANNVVITPTRRGEGGRGGLIDAPLNVDKCPFKTRLNIDGVCREQWYADEDDPDRASNKNQDVTDVSSR